MIEQASLDSSFKIFSDLVQRAISNFVDVLRLPVELDILAISGLRSFIISLEDDGFHSV
jgi:hypothetical protein